VPRGPAHDHEDKRAALRKGAAAFFARHGYDRASMAAVARACGVSKALLYHYHDSKEALLFDILDTHLGALAASMEALPPDEDPKRGLGTLITALLECYRDADAEHHLQLTALETLAAERRAVLVGHQRRMVATLSHAIGACAPGLAGDAQRLRGVTMSVFGMLNWVYLWHRPDRDMPRADLACLVTELALGGISGLTAEPDTCCE
jgi:AcrR family transcriptional regulator